jgi:hypothetical protein
MTIRRNVASLTLVVLCLAAPAEAANRAPAPARPPRAEPDRLTPADAEVLVRVNVRQMLEAPLVKKRALDVLKGALAQREELRKMLAAAGIDPFKDVEAVTISLSGDPARDGKLVAVVRGTFDPAKAQAAADDYARTNPGRLKASKEDGLSLYEVAADNKPLFAAFAGKDALVLTNSKEGTLATVRRAGQRPQAISRNLQAALDRLKGTESVWMATVVTDAVKQVLKNDDGLKNFADALESVTGVVELTADARATLVIHTNDPTAATQIKAKIDEVLPLATFLAAGKDQGARLLKEVIGTIKLAADRTDVSIRLQLTDAQIEKATRKEP